MSTPPPPPSSHCLPYRQHQHVYQRRCRLPEQSEAKRASQDPQPGGDALLKGGVACIAPTPRVEFSPELAKAVDGLSHPQTGRQASMYADVLSVEAVWDRRN